MEVTNWLVTSWGCNEYKKSSKKGWITKKQKEAQFKYSLKEVRFSQLEHSERDKLSKGKSRNTDRDTEQGKHIARGVAEQCQEINLRAVCTATAQRLLQSSRFEQNGPSHEA